jgi:hypothetical protein
MTQPSPPTDTPPKLTGNEEAVVLFTANTDEGRPFFAYIKLTLLKLAEFHEAQAKQGPIDLNRLGTVLETGWGHQPPKDVHERIVAEHGDVLSDGD